MGKEEIECVLCKTYSHSVLSVTAIMLPLTLCVLVARGACECSGFLVYIKSASPEGRMGLKS